MSERCPRSWIASAAATLGLLVSLGVAGATEGFAPTLPPAIPLAMWQSAIPSDSPVTADRVSLGRDLFFDPHLSVDDTVSCSSCHDPSHGFSDPRPVSVGVGGKRGARHAPTVLNAMFSPFQFWDGRAGTLEEQATGPMTNALEMGMPSGAAVVTKLAGLPAYRGRFEQAFGRPICLEDISKAIASYERTLVSADSPFDRYMAGDHHALSASAQRGYVLFKTTAQCANCHAVSPESPFFTDFSFHNTGIGARNMAGYDAMANQVLELATAGQLDTKALDRISLSRGSSELGRFLVTRKTKNLGAFKTPSLRDVAVRGPYMHDGSLKTLRDVLDYYNQGCKANINLDKDLHKLNLTSADVDDLEAFLQSLTGDRVRRLVTHEEKP